MASLEWKIPLPLLRMEIDQMKKPEFSCPVPSKVFIPWHHSDIWQPNPFLLEKNTWKEVSISLGVRQMFKLLTFSFKVDVVVYASRNQDSEITQKFILLNGLLQLYCNSTSYFFTVSVLSCSVISILPASTARLPACPQMRFSVWNLFC